MPKPRNILVVTYWSLADGLVRSYVLPYLRIIAGILPSGSTIHLVTLERPGTTNGAIPDDIVHHPFPYHPFGIRGAWRMVGMLFRLDRLVRREHIDVIHAWCTPAGLVGHLLSILTGRPLVVDSYEPHAEAMVENGTWKRAGTAFRLLFLFERLQTKGATVAIGVVEGMRDYAKVAYACVPRNFLVKPACVDLERFSRQNLKTPGLLRSLGLEGKLVAVYAGKFGGIYLDQEVFDFFRIARDHWGNRFHALLLTGHSPEELAPFMHRAGLDPAMFTIRFVPYAEIPDHLGLGDFALTPVKPVPTKRYCSPIKDGEYWALGLPVVITPGISEDSMLIEANATGSILRGYAPSDHERSIAEIDTLLRRHDRMELYDRIRPIAEKHRNFAIAEKVYASVYGANGILFKD